MKSPETEREALIQLVDIFIATRRAQGHPEISSGFVNLALKFAGQLRQMKPIADLEIKEMVKQGKYEELASAYSISVEKLMKELNITSEGQTVN